MPSEPGFSPEVLNGWKEIAAYLGKSPRSAQRWERDLSLPVRRINTAEGGSIVYAHRSELDLWRAGQNALPAASNGNDHSGEVNGHDYADAIVDAIAPEIVAARSSVSVAKRSALGRAVEWSQRPVPVWSAALVVCLAFGTAFAIDWVPLADGQPRTAEIVGDELQAFSQGGRLLWTHSFGRVAHVASTSRRPSLVADIDGDGVDELVVPVRFARFPDRSEESDAVVAFDRRGTVRWLVRPEPTLSDGEATFAGPWNVRDLAVGHTPQGSRVWVAYSHNTWRPGLIVEIAPDGTQRIRHVQGGRFYTLHYWPTSRGHFLAAGGSINEFSRPSLVIIDVTGPPSRSPQRDEPLLSCDGCPTADPKAFILFPTSEVTTALVRPYGWVNRGVTHGDELRISTDDGFGEGSVALVTADFRVVEFERSDRYWQAHRNLESQGRLSHTVDQCPDRDQPAQIMVWTPEAGWQTQSVWLSAAVRGSVKSPPVN
jgi:hypothetical protein